MISGSRRWDAESTERYSLFSVFREAIWETSVCSAGKGMDLAFGSLVLDRLLLSDPDP
jgi:hypothetical protein